MKFDAVTFDVLKSKGVKMRGLGLLSLAFVCAVNVGCVVKHTTQGFQTNPPARVSEGFPHGFQQEQEKSGISKFLAQLNPAKLQGKGQAQQFTSDEIPAERDATSLKSQATVSPELLIVAGEMALRAGPNRQPNYAAASQYFKRALKLDPRNKRANMGLAQAETGLGNHKSAERIYQALREWYPNQTQQSNQPTLNSLGRSKAKKKSTGIQQVSYVEPLAPSKTNKPATADKNPTVMQPELLFSKLNTDQRIANPYFQSQQTAIAPVSHQTEISADRKSGKRRTIVVPAALVIDKAKRITSSSPAKHHLAD